MKNKIKKLTHILRLAKDRPDWRRKFVSEIKHHGIKSAINKMRNKALIATDVAFQPSLIQEEQKTLLLFPVVDNPTVSILIPVYNNFDYTYLCLKSILENTQGIDYEILIADDNSSDETLAIAQYAENITVIRDGINRGFLKNCNNAAQYAKGKYILFLNNDTQVQPEWLSSFVALIESDEKIGMVGSKLVYPDGRLQEAGGIIWKDASGWNYGHRDDPLKPEYNYVKEVDYISGASLMIRKKLWEEIGGFDERYVPAYYEDSDLAFEVRKHGYKVVYQPKSVVVHFEGISNGTDLSSGIKKYQVVNHQKFLDKWKEVLEAEHYPNAENVFLARDRSRFKKHILIIDHYVPHYDQDAGSRTVFAYIKLFVSSDFHVKFIGENFFAHQPYTDVLQKMGVEVLYGNDYFSHWKDWIGENGKYLDYIFLNRPHIAEKFINTMKEYTKAKIIYYGHDLHFLREMREFELHRNEFNQKQSAFWKEKEIALMHKADISFYPSEVEVEIIKGIDDTIRVASLPAYLFEEFTDDIQSTSNKARKDIMFVGGFAHTPNEDGIIWFVENIWPKIVQRCIDIKLHIIGSKPTEKILSLQSESINVTGFVNDDVLIDYYKKCCLSIIPLRYGAGIKGKVVEALYNQIPVVTTSIGAEGLINAGKYMKIADNVDTFGEAVIELYSNPAIQEEYARKSKNYCAKYFSFESARKALQAVIDWKGESFK